jgi:hypothetical protein
MNRGESRDHIINFIKQIGEELVLLGAMAPEQLKEAYRVERNAGLRGERILRTFRSELVNPLQ